MMRRKLLRLDGIGVVWAGLHAVEHRRQQHDSAGEAPPPPEDPTTDAEDPLVAMAHSITDPSHSGPAPESRGSGGGGRFAEYVSQEASSALFRNALSEFDPFGGMAREDYFRDPAEGFANRYAPRNFVTAGDVEYTHPLTTTRYTTSLRRRESLEHEVDRYRQTARDLRGALRSGTTTDSAAQASEEGKQRTRALSWTSRVPSDSAFDVAFTESSVFRAPHTAVPGPIDQAVHSRAQSAHPNTFISERTLGAGDQDVLLRTREHVQRDAVVSHLFHQIHGLPERDAFEEDRATRRQNKPFRGYDPGGAAGARIPIPRTVAPSAMSEAQTSLRQNILDTTSQAVASVMSTSTTAVEPATGAVLAARVADHVETSRRHSLSEADDAFTQKHGFGRQGTLVSESGPDNRKIQMHKNDERLFRAAVYSHYEYAAGDVLDQDDPVLRNSVSHGVEELLDNKFDIDRRAYLLAKGRPDPLERSQIHYGVPVKQYIDHQVRFSAGRASERHPNFFTPFPKQHEMKLFEVYDDVLGFPLFRTRNPERFEFELFERYRAHHQQRRRLALLHGLEPKVGETVQERNTRRAKLDILCEQTPFDEALMSPTQTVQRHRSSVEVLRQWFGAYWIPSPTLTSQILGTELQTGLQLVEKERKTLNIIDRREHLLSSRYINCLLTVDAMNTRLQRGYIKDALTACPEVEIAFRQQHHVLRHFTPEQRQQYDEYVAALTERHFALWKSVLLQRRFLSDRGCYATAASFFEMDVVHVREVASGTVQLVSRPMFESIVEQRDPATGAILLDNMEVVPVSPHDFKETDDGVVSKVVFVSVKPEQPGEEIFTMTEASWTALPLEAPSPQPNRHIHGNSGDTSPFNRVNYIETQDFIWEDRVAKGAEGWTQALQTDNITVKKPVLARRTLEGGRIGDPERGVVVHYEGQPFYNPNPRTVSVRFLSDDTVQHVCLSNVLVWQVGFYGPDRTAPLETREYSTGARYVDLADPKGQRQIVKSKPHFLDAYMPDYRAQRTEAAFRRSRNVRDVDNFGTEDVVRGENHRLLSISHRLDHVVQQYFPRYTPWEFISLQESEAPQIMDQIRTDDTGPAHFHSPNRFWTRKRRPFGEIKNFYNEVRDFMQYVDGVTTWDAAKKIRTLWEVREHHPTPYYNRPNVALHRNTPALLPSHLWEADKRTGAVKSLKDTVRGYRPTVQAPAWAGE